MARATPKPKKSKRASDPAPEYKPTPEEREALAAFTAAREARKPSPGMTIKKTASGAYTFGAAHEDPGIGHLLLMQAIGTTDFYFVHGVLSQTANATKSSEPDENAANFMLAVVKGIEPRDQVETMLAMQMAAVHLASMTFARRLAHVDNIPQQDSASNALNKLMRTFAAQTEALKRYRSTGEQKVTVQHVTVQPGGQAIVGNVSPGKPANDAGQSLSTPLPALVPPSETPLPLPGGGGVQQRKVRAIP